MVKLTKPEPSTAWFLPKIMRTVLNFYDRLIVLTAHSQVQDFLLGHVEDAKKRAWRNLHSRSPNDFYSICVMYIVATSLKGKAACNKRLKLEKIKTK